MQTQSNRKRGPQLSTLTPLIKCFVGLELTVELKNGRSYFGFLEDSDDDMNLTLSSSTCDTAKQQVELQLQHISDGSMIPEDQTTAITHQQGQNDLGVFHFSKVHIRGSTIRYIHFPDDADLPALIRVGLDRKRAAQDKYARGKRRKR